MTRTVVAAAIVRAARLFTREHAPIDVTVEVLEAAP
jgi:hypothetical protein